MELSGDPEEVHFTRREQDVIACLLHGRGLKKTAQLLSISPSTVETHTRNIMVKLGCHSRENVIDILEQSGRAASFKKRYAQLVHVPKSLKKIKRSLLSLQKLKRKSLINQKNPQQESSQEIQEESVQDPLKELSFYKTLLKRVRSYKAVLWGGSVCLSLVGLCLFMIIQGIDTSHKDLLKLPAIRCEILLPHQTTLLNRSSLIKKIEDKFKKPEDIQTVILMGMGGVGKTTLARQYIRAQEAPVIWEINAETKETLILSFEKLAEALTQTEGDQRKFIKIDSKLSPKREEKLLKYVKKKLLSRPHWVLFYDNVEKFSDIDPYFPYDSKIWGAGKILITTRNSMIGHHKYIDSHNVLKVGELTSEEQFTLFTRILSQESIFPITPSKKKETQQFLENLSPFPLDISTAVFYLKTTHLSYADYLKHLKECDDKFNRIQEGILREVNDYTKTRYGIISLSIRSLIHNNQDFRELLLLISLLDSQDIPRDLLSYSKKPLVADQLLYHLKRNSLISEKVTSSKRTFSLHRSTQAIILTYLTHLLELEKNPSLIEQAAAILENYSEHLQEKGNTLEMKRFIPHMIHLRDSAKAISKTLIASLNDKLGLLYFSTRLDYLKAKNLLKESITIYQEHYKTPHPKTAKALLTLARIHQALGRYEEEKKFVGQSFELYKKCYPDEDSIEMVELFIHLGNLYKRLGDYTKARFFLEKSYWIYKNHYGENSIYTVRVLGILGRFYRCIGDFKKAQKLLESSLWNYHKYHSESLLEIALLKISLGRVYKSLENYTKAKQLMEEGLSFCKQHLGSNHIDIAWEQMHLASVYGRLGDWRTAKHMTEKSLITLKKHYGTVSSEYIWALKKLGSVHRKLGEYDVSVQILERSLSLCQKHYDAQDHVEVVSILSQLGKTYLLKGDFKKAEELLCKALQILKKKNYPKTYRVLEVLVELCLRESSIEYQQKNLAQGIFYKNKARHYFKELRETLKTYCPLDSSYARQIEAQQRLIMQNN